MNYNAIVFDVLPAANTPHNATDPALDKPEIFFKLVEPQVEHLVIQFLLQIIEQL